VSTNRFPIVDILSLILLEIGFSHLSKASLLDDDSNDDGRYNIDKIQLSLFFDYRVIGKKMI
jgi:hypothetical protein